MLKEIYIIKNKINDKVYIGQSVNSAQRWRAHLSNARLKTKWSAIDFAINKLGAENFYYEIIEITEDFDNRETYWIQKYDSIMPKGYNYCCGGDGAQPGINSANAKIRNNESLENIINDLLYTSKKQEDIAKEYNVSKQVISSINRGNSYRLNNFSYPLRKKRKDLNEETIKQIQEDLFSKEYNKAQLAVKYSCSLISIEHINKGIIGKNNKYHYPIYSGKHSKLGYDEISEIITLLKDSNVKISEIAEKYSVSSTQIRNINNGKSWNSLSLSYPLRKI